MRYCLNNPLIYIDPDGEFWNLVIGPAIGEITNLILNADNIDSFGEGLGYFAVGAAAGALSAGVGGATAGALNIGGFAGGSLVGSAAGFTGGFTAGAGNAWIGGEDFGSGLTSGLKTGAIGGVTGGILGGLAGGFQATNHNGDFWNGNGSIYESGTSEFVSESKISEAKRNARDFNTDLSTEVLRARMKDEMGVSVGDYGISDLTTDFDRSVFGLTGRLKYVRLSDGEIINGYAQSIGRYSSSVHISPGVTYSNITKFIATAGHELIHAYHISTIGSGALHRAFTEKIAYDYSTRILSDGNIVNRYLLMKYIP